MKNDENGPFLGYSASMYNQNLPDKSVQKSDCLFELYLRAEMLYLHHMLESCLNSQKYNTDHDQSNSTIARANENRPLSIDFGSVNQRWSFMHLFGNYSRVHLGNFGLVDQKGMLFDRKFLTMLCEMHLSVDYFTCLNLLLGSLAPKVWY